MVEHTEKAQVGGPAVVARRYPARASANEAEHDRVALLDVIEHHGLGQVKVVGADGIHESTKLNRVHYVFTTRLELASETSSVA